MAHITATPTYQPKSPSFNPIQWLLGLERAYREAQQLKSTEDHNLKDMGITRREANAAFYTQYSENRWYSRDR